MTKIIISIVSFLLVLFPFSSTLLATQQQLSFPGVQEITNDIVEAIKSNDIGAIENMLSEETKQKIEDTKKEIGAFFQTIDGQVVKTMSIGGGGETSESGSGYVYKVKTWGLKIETTQNTYRIMITWVIADTKWPEHCGLVGITLYDMADNLLAEIS